MHVPAAKTHRLISGHQAHAQLRHGEVEGGGPAGAADAVLLGGTAGQQAQVQLVSSSISAASHQLRQCASLGKAEQDGRLGWNGCCLCQCG